MVKLFPQKVGSEKAWCESRFAFGSFVHVTEAGWLGEFWMFYPIDSVRESRTYRFLAAFSNNLTVKPNCTENNRFIPRDINANNILTHIQQKTTECEQCRTVVTAPLWHTAPGWVREHEHFKTRALISVITWSMLCALGTFGLEEGSTSLMTTATMITAG